jgi:hypothetical protein
MEFNELASFIHAKNIEAGWWDNDPCIITKLQLVNTEIAEATEGERKDMMDDHLPTRKMGEVELADALIRMLDLGGKMGWTYSPELHGNMASDIAELYDRLDNVASRHGMLTFINSGLLFGTLLSIDDTDDDKVLGFNETYTCFIVYLMATAEIEGYDIEGALYEKLEYNEMRADHKPENRAAANGKRF